MALALLAVTATVAIAVVTTAVTVQMHHVVTTVF
jgi:hypothetical protein